MLKLLLLLVTTSCAFFVNKIDTALVDQKDYLENIPQVASYCPIDQKVNLQLVGSNAHSQGLFQEFFNTNTYDFFDQMVLWTLVQMSLRPDQSSPTSRFQIILQWQGKTQYWDFFSEEPNDQLPLLYGLDWILKKNGKKNSLESYAEILDSRFSHKLRVGKVLETFLRKYAVQIKADTELAPLFVKGTDVLQENERVPRFAFRDVVRYYRTRQSKQKMIINSSLIPFSSSTGQGSCNYDFNLYENSIFLIDKTVPDANIFGLSKGKGAFLAATSQKFTTPMILANFPLFKGESKVRSTAVCMMEEGPNKVWLYSNQSRDPGQHLFHLIRYGISSSQSTADVDKLIRHSRHLFLSDPVRLIIESGRSRSDQVENLLKLNIPIYNAERMGNIWAYTLFNDQGRFIIDDRNIGAYLCK